MYEYKFLNSPDLVSALNRLGPEGLFDFFLPDLRDYVARYGDTTMEAVRKLFAERIRPLYGKALRTDELYKSIFTLWHDGAREALRLNDPEDEAFQRFFAHLANHVWTLDNQPEEALKQIEAGEFDSYAIRRKHLALLGKDPQYVADEFVRRLARAHGFGPRLRKLAYISIGRIALKESRRDIAWCKRQSGVNVNHIADWLVGAVATEAAWLSNVDDQGRPKKLMKFGSLDAMHAEAEKHMKRALAAEAAAVASEEETFADEGGEYRIVRLKTPRALDYESNAMRHCIGHGAYDRYLGHDGFLLLSLRDKGNRPHVTIQVNHRKIVQFSGKANSEPKPEYRQAALGLLSPLGIGFPEETPLDNPCREIEMPEVIPPPYQEFGGYPQ
ncbi:PcfJ domain-containing protein [Pararhizobium sp. BT-229]|uniref:PcfJ domain-containing protein n=1 Tax=Pararhizobium sp. BT-229 TaxID=2986923 RepID=UPI0021F72917|nr:PcfJ domain-containing protein [Pararhizobium sp. BT-229]MCV9963864.1 PcfJ domain-containing protein [Pararhizobium sp. BT-229]